MGQLQQEKAAVTEAFKAALLDQKKELVEDKDTALKDQKEEFQTDMTTALKDQEEALKEEKAKALKAQEEEYVKDKEEVLKSFPPCPLVPLLVEQLEKTTTMLDTRRELFAAKLSRRKLQKRLWYHKDQARKKGVATTHQLDVVEVLKATADLQFDRLKRRCGRAGKALEAIQEEVAAKKKNGEG